jgi:uncharacterized repeat protein (TIGR01451 family)
VTGSVTNTATATTPTLDSHGNPASASGSTTNPVGVVTSLSVTKTLEGTLVAGSPATYDIAVTDDGPSDAAGPITVTDPLPTGLTYVSSTSADGFICSATGQDVTCTTPDDVGLPNGATISVDLTVDLASNVTGSVTNTATATTPTLDSHGNPASASGSTTNPVNTVTSLSVTKAVVGTLVAGSSASYVVAVSDTGPSDAAGSITVTDPLPAGLTYVSSSSPDGFTCSATGQDVTCATPDDVGLPNGSMISVTVAVTVAQNLLGTDVTNTATATTPTLDSHGNPASGSGTTTNPVGAVTSLSVTKTLEGNLVSGSPATYSIAVTDTGPSDAAGPITVTDPLPAGLTYVSSSSSDGFTCSATGQDATCATPADVGLPNGDTISVEITVQVAPNVTGSVTNTATATTPTLNSNGNPASGTGSTTDPAGAVTSLSLTKTLDGHLVAGSPATYSIAITDTGPSDAAGPITVTDPLPAGLTYVSSSSSDGFTCSATGQDVTCATPADVGLPNGDTISVEITVQVVPNVTGSVTNTATATTPTLDSSGSPASASGSTADPVAAVAVLSVTKTLLGADLVVGHLATYSISITDHGPSDAAGPITVTDPLPTGLTYVSSSSSDGFRCAASGQAVTCMTGSGRGIAAGTSISVQLTVDVTTAVTARHVTNVATASSPTPGGRPRPPSGSVTSTVILPSVVPPANTGEPWSTWWWWAMAAVTATAGILLVWLPMRRRRRRVLI